MTDREERQHVIEVLKQMRLDYEDFWEENDTEEIKAMNYAIASIETDLKYDLLYEQESNCSEIPTGSTAKDYLGVDAVSRQVLIDWLKNWTLGDATPLIDFVKSMPSVTPQFSSGLEKNSKKLEKGTIKDYLGVDYLGVDCISRKAVQTRLKEIINEMETIFADIREREVNDSVCGLCEYDCDHGLDGFANECPGFEKDDCFKLKEKYRAEWLDISNMPSVTPQFSSELEKNSKKLENPTTKDYLGVDYLGVDCISRSDVLKLMQDNWHTHNGDWAMQESMDDIRALPAVTPQEPRKGHWIEHPRTKELRFHHIYECSACKTQIIGNRYNVGNYKYCPHCGIEFEVEE